MIAALNGKVKVSGSIRPGKKLDAGFAQMIACLGVSSALGDHLKQLGGTATGGGVFGQYLDLATVVLANGAGGQRGPSMSSGRTHLSKSSALRSPRSRAACFSEVPSA